MLEVITNNAVVTADSVIPLQSITLLKGCTVSPQGNNIVLKKSGVYAIHVDANAISADATGAVSIQLAKNGVLLNIPNSETVANATAIHSLSLNALVRVKEASCCETPVSISVMNVGNGATVDMNVVVTKVF